jgi:hypothetical protein
MLAIFTPKIEIKLLGIAKFLEEQNMYRVIINDCPIAAGVENPHKFWMCRQPRNVRQTSR